VFSIDKVSEVVKFVNYFHETNTGDESMLFGILGGMPEIPMPCIFCIVFMNGTTEEGEAFFKPLLDIGPLANMVKTMPYPEANNHVP
jgi:hypothetical protein